MNSPIRLTLKRAPTSASDNHKFASTLGHSEQIKCQAQITEDGTIVVNGEALVPYDPTAVLPPGRHVEVWTASMPIVQGQLIPEAQ